jgi:hypothetical protein
VSDGFDCMPDGFDGMADSMNKIPEYTSSDYSIKVGIS